MKTLSEACEKLMKRLPLDHPVTMKFSPERLTADLRDSRWKSYKNRGLKDGQISEGPAWIGSNGRIVFAKPNMKRHYLKCAEQFGEEAAKIWAFQQCYTVNPHASYIDLFTEELDSLELDVIEPLKEEIDGADKPIHPGTVDTADDTAGDRTDEQTGSNVVTDIDELPF